MNDAIRPSNGNHERWLAETWRMIEDCAKDNSEGHRVSLSAKGCAALLAERRSIETSEPRRRERIAAQIAHGMLHILDDSEENAQTGVVSLEISGEDWQELNRVIELLGNDPHEVLHNMIGVNS